MLTQLRKIPVLSDTDKFWGPKLQLLSRFTGCALPRNHCSCGSPCTTNTWGVSSSYWLSPGLFLCLLANSQHSLYSFCLFLVSKCGAHFNIWYFTITSHYVLETMLGIRRSCALVQRNWQLNNISGLSIACILSPITRRAREIQFPSPHTCIQFVLPYGYVAGEMFYFSQLRTVRHSTHRSIVCGF